jgi:hypothetical protein
MWVIEHHGRRDEWATGGVDSRGNATTTESLLGHNAEPLDKVRSDYDSDGLYADAAARL